MYDDGKHVSLTLVTLFSGINLFFPLLHFYFVGLLFLNMGSKRYIITEYLKVS